MEIHRDRLLRRRRLDRQARTVATGAPVRLPRAAVHLDAAFDAMLACVDRRDRLDRAIEAMPADSAFTPVVTRLGCLRGVSTLTAFGLAVEIGYWQRLSGRSIGAYLGLVPPDMSLWAQAALSPRHHPRPTTV